MGRKCENMPREQYNIVEYTVYFISEFAKQYAISEEKAFEYLYRYGGIKLIEDFYDVMHTQSFSDMVDSTATYCKRNGGDL